MRTGAALALRSLCDGHHKKAFFIAELREKNRAFLTASASAGISSDLMQSHGQKRFKQGEQKMSRKASTTLAVLLVFGTASVALADTNKPSRLFKFIRPTPGVDDVQRSQPSRLCFCLRADHRGRFSLCDIASSYSTKL